MKVSVGGLEIGYRRTGQGPALVLVHGALTDGGYWRPQLEGLGDEFARGGLGRGRSRRVHRNLPPDFTLAGYAGALAGLIGALELAPAHVCGLSWGGSVALALFRDHPACVRSLVLADSYAGWRGSLPADEVENRLAAARALAAEPPERPEALWPGLLSPGASAEVVRELSAAVAGFRPASVGAVGEIMASCDLRELLPTVDVPTLLLWGELDERSPRAVAEQINAGIPGSRLVFIPGAGHVSSLGGQNTSTPSCAGRVLPVRRRRSALRPGRASSPPRSRDPSAARSSRAGRAAAREIRAHLVHRVLERLGVGLRGLREATDLADVLEGRGAHLVLGGGRLEVVEGADVAAHALRLVRQSVSGGRRSARPAPWLAPLWPSSWPWPRSRRQRPLRSPTRTSASARSRQSPARAPRTRRNCAAGWAAAVLRSGGTSTATDVSTAGAAG